MWIKDKFQLTKTVMWIKDKFQLTKIVMNRGNKPMHSVFTFKLWLSNGENNSLMNFKFLGTLELGIEVITLWLVTI